MKRYIIWQGYINFRLTKTRVAKGFCVTRDGPKICRVMRDLIEDFSVMCDWNPPLQTSITSARSSWNVTERKWANIPLIKLLPVYWAVNHDVSVNHLLIWYGSGVSVKRTWRIGNTHIYMLASLYCAVPQFYNIRQNTTSCFSVCGDRRKNLRKDHSWSKVRIAHSIRNLLHLRDHSNSSCILTISTWSFAQSRFIRHSMVHSASVYRFIDFSLSERFKINSHLREIKFVRARKVNQFLKQQQTVVGVSGVSSSY